MRTIIIRLCILLGLVFPALAFNGFATMAYPSPAVNSVA